MANNISVTGSAKAVYSWDAEGFCDTTISGLISALEAMMLEGMPGNSEVRVMHHESAGIRIQAKWRSTVPMQESLRLEEAK